MRRGICCTLLLLAGCHNASSAPTSASSTTTDTAVTTASSTPIMAATSATASASATADAGSASTATMPGKISFDDMPVGESPKGFTFGRTGSGAAGKWLVRVEKDAPSPPNALVQTSTDPTDYRFPVAVADAPTTKDVRATVRCKPLAGRVDQACGLVVRYQDENNYMLARANALEDNVRLYVVKAGQRRQIAGFNGKVESGKWHTLSLEAHGDKFEVTFDGKKVIEQPDGTNIAAGRVGLWTKADSVTAFDDLTIESF